MRRRVLLTLRPRRPVQCSPAVRVVGMTAAQGSGFLVVRVATDYAGDSQLYYHWFLDGLYYTTTRSPSLSIAVSAGEQFEVRCVATPHVAWSPWTGAQNVGYGARRTLFWVRPNEAVDYYRCEWVESPTTPADDDYTEFQRVVDTGAWSYTVLTPRLTDGAPTWLRVVPVRNGNATAAPTVVAETIVRKPDGIVFTATRTEAGTITFALST